MGSPRRESSSKRSNEELKTETRRSDLTPSIRATNLYRHNKLYRCPRTPPPEIQFDLEQSFILDCKAVSNISNDYSRANPKLGSVIPPYNSQIDSHCQSYFQFSGIPKTLERSRQLLPHESTAGDVYDRFYTNGHGHRYLSRRNKFGSGHSIDEVRGHELFLSDSKPVINYNGLFGYRRNTPSLRKQPTIGTKTLDNKKGIVPFGRFPVVGCGKSYDYHCQCKFDQPCRCHNQDELCSCVKA